MSPNWKPILGYEGIYEVSDAGLIRRIAGWTDGRPNRVRGERKPSKSQSGYHHLTLFRDKTKTGFRVHRLVYEAFNGPIPSGKEINHKNGNKSDNRLENLEAITHSENKVHAYRVLKVPHFRGSDSWNAKITEADALAIRTLRVRGWKLKRIAREFSLSIPSVCWIAKHKTWRHI